MEHFICVLGSYYPVSCLLKYITVFFDPYQMKETPKESNQPYIFPKA